MPAPPTATTPAATQARPPPRLAGADHSLALLRNPYGFIARACRERGSDVVEARLLTRPVLCLTGPAAAALFYDPQRMQRAGAAPEPLRATLFGKGAVQGLDGAAHRQRKALFLAALGPPRVAELRAQLEREWRIALEHWQREPRIVLYDALRPVLTRAVHAWAGVPLADAALAQRCEDLSLLFDSPVMPPLRHLRSRAARWRLEDTLAQAVADARRGGRDLSAGSAAHALAWQRDEDGALLSPRIAAVELLNLLRPTVAVSVFMVFAAHALHLHPGWRARLAGSADPRLAEAFVQEVRRHYPFFPSVMARVRRDFDWQGWRFERGQRVLLDLHGTNHDPRCWDEPEAFRPERFLGAAPGPFEFVPQGGGDAASGHRCPGEAVVIALTGLALTMLTKHMRYRVADQDLTVATDRLPALPRDGFVIESIQAPEPGPPAPAGSDKP